MDTPAGEKGRARRAAPAGIRAAPTTCVWEEGLLDLSSDKQLAAKRIINKARTFGSANGVETPEETLSRIAYGGFGGRINVTTSDAGNGLGAPSDPSASGGGNYSPPQPTGTVWLDREDTAGHNDFLTKGRSSMWKEETLNALLTSRWCSNLLRLDVAAASGPWVDEMG
ncbi:hypothetical protein EJB05_16127, partial [Eragrostis curvula]